MSCHVDGLKMGFALLMHLLEKSARTAQSMGTNLRKHSRWLFSKKTLNSASNKNGKRKHNCIDTYNDLNDNGFNVNNEEESDNNSNNKWVTKNEFYI